MHDSMPGNSLFMVLIMYPCEIPIELRIAINNSLESYEYNSSNLNLDLRDIQNIKFGLEANL